MASTRAPQTGRRQSVPRRGDPPRRFRVRIDHTARITSPRSYTIIFQLGGALARVAEDETAYSQRDAAFNVNINAVWLDGDSGADEHIRWTRDLYGAVEPHTGGRVYVNFLGDEGEKRVRAAYGEEKYEQPAVECATTWQQKMPICRRLSTGATGLEPATSGVTGRRSNQLNYAP